MRLVAISGIDGTGKTTLASSIVEGLSADGIAARYVYLRTRPLLARAAMAAGRAVWLRGTDPWSDYGGFARRRTATLRGGFLGAGYASTVLVDYFIQTWWRLLLNAKGNGILVVDRYWMDTVVSDIAVHLGLTMRQTTRLVAGGYRLLPRPLLALLLDAPVEVAFRRKSDVPDAAYLGERRRYFLGLPRGPHIKVVDGSRAADDVYREAMSLVRAAISRGAQP